MLRFPRSGPIFGRTGRTEPDRRTSGPDPKMTGPSHAYVLQQHIVGRWVATILKSLSYNETHLPFLLFYHRRKRVVLFSSTEQFELEVKYIELSIEKMYLPHFILIRY